MATLTSEERTKIRQACAKTLTVNYTKAQINLAVQAVEDWIMDNAAALSSAIDTATSPFTFTNPQKKKIVAEWAEYKFNKDK